MISIVSERPSDAAAIEHLLDQVFGPGRFARTAYRLREGTEPVDGLSFVAVDGDTLHGSIRFSQVRVGESEVLFLGPLVVCQEDRGKGIGLGLMEQGLVAARGFGALAVLLVGDLPYYERAGFEVIPSGRVKPIGPIDPGRLLGLEFEPGVLNGLQGPLMPLHAATSE